MRAPSRVNASDRLSTIRFGAPKLPLFRSGTERSIAVSEVPKTHEGSSDKRSSRRQRAQSRVAELRETRGANMSGYELVASGMISGLLVTAVPYICAVIVGAFGFSAFWFWTLAALGAGAGLYVGAQNALNNGPVMRGALSFIWLCSQSLLMVFYLVFEFISGLVALIFSSFN